MLCVVYPYSSACVHATILCVYVICISFCGCAYSAHTWEEEIILTQEEETQQQEEEIILQQKK